MWKDPIGKITLWFSYKVKEFEVVSKTRLVQIQNFIPYAEKRMKDIGPQQESDCGDTQDHSATLHDVSQELPRWFTQVTARGRDETTF